MNAQQRIKNQLGWWVVLLSLGLANAQPLTEPVVIPRPAEITVAEGSFTINASTRILLSEDNESLKETAAMLASLIQRSSGLKLTISTTNNSSRPTNSILLKLADYGLPKEGYELCVNKETVDITAQDPAGIFYGLQTIRQLLPAEIETPKPVDKITLTIPAVRIKDQPRFEWRGLMLDESRHFFGKETVLKLIDQMAMYKLNRFHWHLTDTDGWRIEIKKYPKLTIIGGIGDRTDPNAPARFYTQSDIKEVVAYAQSRHIIMIPEIDMPGHAAAANRAYPEYSGGGSKRHPEFTFNPGSEATYRYLEDILTEVANLFPGPWLHLGGDEVRFGCEQWNTLPEVQALMQKEGFTKLLQVERYFIRRMQSFISNKLNKTTIGWDEIAGFEVDPDSSLLMWWRHDKPEICENVVKAGYDVILCPRIPCYLDFVQHRSHKVGRRWQGFSSLEEIIGFPTYAASYSDEDKKRIIGMQCNVWTELIKTTERLDFMVFPRLLAIAESSWTPASRKELENFQLRLRKTLPRLEALGINYFDPFDPEKTPEPIR